MFGLGRFGSHSWSVPALEMTIHLFLDILFEILPYHFSWQAQHLARVESDTCCSAHCKRRFICNDDEACKSFCVAGAVFGQVGSWHLLLRALWMTFHMWRRWSMRVFLRGRCNIWWGWIVTPVAQRIVSDVSYVIRLKQASHFAWQVQPLVKFKWHFLRQVQHLAKFKRHLSWQVQHLVTFKCHFSWQVQHLVKFKCRFSWQVQHLMKFKGHFS